MFRNKNKKRRNYSLNNQGFSLVEVLIAVSILIVIAVPMALNLITSAQINSKAKQITSASHMAESMMEVIQTLDLADILTDMNGYDVDQYGKQLSYKISNDLFEGYDIGGFGEVVFADDTYAPVSDMTSSMRPIVQNGNTIPRFVGNNNDEYAFLVSGVETSDAYFDILTTFNFERKYGGINLTDLNKDTTVCISQDAYMDKNVVDEFKHANSVYVAMNADESTIAEYTQTEQWYLNNMNRTITIDVVKVDENVTKITITATYVVESDCLFESDKTIVKEIGSFVAASNREMKDGIYLYYNALFDTDRPRDNIVINNDNELDLSIYLIAGSTTSYFDFTNVANYHPSIKLVEVFGGAEQHASVYSNVANDLWNSTLLPHNSSFDVQLVRDNNQRAFYTATIQVYQHRDICFNGNVFTPNDKYLLVKTVGYCVSDICVPADTNKPNVDTSIITFTIGGNMHRAKSGMTWAEWIDSSYNTGYNGEKFVLDERAVVAESYGSIYLVEDLGFVWSDDEILPNFNYGIGNLNDDLFLFTINGIIYNAEEGMTWSEWINSTYNTGIAGCKFTCGSNSYDGVVADGIGAVYYLDYNEASYVSGMNHQIQQNYNYLCGYLNGTPAAGTFRFTIWETEFIAEDGMTWLEWVDSQYNTGYWDDDIICESNADFVHLVADGCYLFDEWGAPIGSDEIIPNYNYDHG